MTDPRVQRLLALLGATGMSTAEFRGLIRELNSIPISELSDAFRKMREAIKHIDVSGSQYSILDTFSQVKDDVVNFARRSEPSPSEAALRLRQRLLSTNEELDIPDWQPKQGFSRWLTRVLQVVEPSVVLNAAIVEFSDSRVKSEHGWKLSD